jgi:hypothetical protein
VTPQEGATLVKMPEGNDFSPVLGSFMNASTGDRLLSQTFQLHNLGDRERWADDATRNIPIHYYYAYMAQAQAESQLGRAAQAQHMEAEAQKYEGLSRR